MNCMASMESIPLQPAQAVTRDAITRKVNRLFRQAYGPGNEDTEVQEVLKAERQMDPQRLWIRNREPNAKHDRDTDGRVQEWRTY